VRKSARRVALYGLLVLAACTRVPGRAPPRLLAPPAPADDSLGDVEQRAVSLAKGWITVKLFIPRDPPGPKPAIVGPIDDRGTLLERGIVLVRFHTNWGLLAGLARARENETPAEQPGSERQAGPPPENEKPATEQNTVGTWLLAAPRPGIVGKAYFGLISQDALHTLPQVMDYLESVPEIDPGRIAIAGSSTGGFVALEALAGEPRFAAAVVRVACGDYHEFLRASSLALGGDPRWLDDGKLRLDADYEEMLRDIEPIRKADRFPPRPLLMLNGATDSAIPLDCVRPTTDALAAAYARRRMSDRFRSIIYDGQGHNLGPRAAADSLAWWDRWLLGRAMQ